MLQTTLNTAADDLETLYTSGSYVTVNASQVRVIP